jgi:flagellar hook-length control protein FliK
MLTAPPRVVTDARPRYVEGGTRAAGPSVFDQVLDQVVARAKLETAEGLSRFTVQLKPEFLGRMQIQTDLSRNQGLHAVIRVEDASVRRLVESSLPSLLEKLAEAGLNVETAEVTDLSDGNERWADRKGEHANPRGGGNSSSSSSGQETEAEAQPDEESRDRLVNYFA